jgi:tetratricopeptide (TPR) repeat protein
MKILHNIFLLALIFLFLETPAQVSVSQLKEKAIDHMSAGRYGEAIDLLNKYISANPREAEGYNLRGLCFENRSQLQSAFNNLRQAYKLEPKNKEYIRNLSRITATWHKELNEIIDGRKREIAIKPDNPYNYLEIGKAYKGLEDWENAEIWYDKYLAMDDNASPDEIIRYSEVLAYNKHYTKGERILRKYTDRYPDDWRLWSRYGYFLLWLGKYKNSEKAFENALVIKPFFKEAVDGLDLAKREGYVTTITPGKVFPIDRFYRILRRNPKDHNTRFRLVDELIKYKRIEEALTQLKILQEDFSGNVRFEEKWEYVNKYRSFNYTKKIEASLARLRKNPNDINAVKTAIEYFSYLEEYDKALDVIKKYFAQKPRLVDPSIKYEYARILAWQGENDSSAAIMDTLLAGNPGNLNYQLFRGQLAIWAENDLDLADAYLKNVNRRRPNNIDALVSLSTLYMLRDDFQNSNKYADLAKRIDPYNVNVEELFLRIKLRRELAAERRMFRILEEGRRLFSENKCDSAISFYTGYLSGADTTEAIMKELGDVYFCADSLDAALQAYAYVNKEILNYDAGMQSAKIYYAKGDSLNAVNSFKQVTNNFNDDFNSHLFLGDAYAQAEMYDSARVVYDSLLTWNIDSSKINSVNQRIGWLPVTGFYSILATFPYYVGFSPSASFYSDNVSFRLQNTGGRVELGVNNQISIGFSFFRNLIKSADRSQEFNTFKGLIYFRPNNSLTLGGGFGVVNSTDSESMVDLDLFARYTQEDRLNFLLNYQKTNSALMLYSGNLIGTSFGSDMYKFDYLYKHKTGLKLFGFYQYLTINDQLNNEGENLQIRVGKEIIEELEAGYEYYYSNFKYNTFNVFQQQLYYSPQNFESHSLWGEWEMEKEKDYEIILGGKIGYVTLSEFLIREIFGDLKYQLLEGLTLNGRITLGSTSRDDSRYNYFSGQISAYWNL